MKNPNGYGTVYKMHGKRRRPYVVKIFVTIDKESGRNKYKTIGYFANRADAMRALASHNGEITDMTFKEVYERVESEHIMKLSDASKKTYSASMSAFYDIWNSNFGDLTYDDLQDLFDESGKHAPTKQMMRTLLHLMYKYALKHNVADKDLSPLIEWDTKDNPNKRSHARFAADEVEKIKVLGTNDSKLVYIMLYTGLRIGELVNLKWENIDLDNQVLSVISSKTEAGIRTVPIADNLKPYFMGFKGGVYLYDRPNVHNIEDEFRDEHFYKVMKKIGAEHRPHDTRHTFISMLADNKTDWAIIRRIVGHSGKGVTETVYTHYDMSVLLDAVNDICK